jgi:hypothetical protein
MLAGLTNVRLIGRVGANCRIYGPYDLLAWRIMKYARDPSRVGIASQPR